MWVHHSASVQPLAIIIIIIIIIIQMKAIDEAEYKIELNSRNRRAEGERKGETRPIANIRTRTQK